MKKRFITAILLASMTLSACGGSSSNESEGEQFTNQGDGAADVAKEEDGEGADAEQGTDGAENASDEAGEQTDSDADSQTVDAGQISEDGDVEGVSETTGDSEDASSENTAEESAGADSGVLADFQKAYIDIIEQGRPTPQQLKDVNFDLGTAMDSYILYDIDKDDVPELIVRYGDCEAAYMGKVYTYKDGSAVIVADDLGLGHTGFYSVPGENGILSYWAHMGCMSCGKMSIVDGKEQYESIYEEEIMDEIGEDGGWYKEASDIVEGAVYLDYFPVSTTYPIVRYAEIEKLTTGESTAAGSYSFPDGNENIYTELMDGNGTVTAVAMDQFMQSPGKVQFNTLLDEGVIYAYAPGSMNIVDIGYADFNSDGIYECYFYFTEPDAQSTSHSYRGIISRQDGEFYVYLSFYPGENEITEDGVMKTDDEEYFIHNRRRVLFDKEECFELTIS